MDIVDRLLDLQKQATLERSHYYVASYDHYWNFHKHAKEWADLCPVCKERVELGNNAKSTRSYISKT